MTAVCCGVICRPDIRSRPLYCLSRRVRLALGSKLHAEEQSGELQHQAERTGTELHRHQQEGGSSHRPRE